MEAKDCTVSKSGLQQEPRGKTSSKQSSVNPRDTANFFSVLVFGWIQSLLTKGRKKTLEDEDLFPLMKNSDTKQLTESLNFEWRKEIEDSNKNKRPPRLWIVLLRLVPVRSYVLMSFVFILKAVAQIVLPLTLGLFLRMLADPSRSVQSSVLYILALSGACTVKFITLQHGDFLTESWSMKLCAAINGLVYNKLLTLSRSSLTRISQGQIINLVSNDVQRLRRFINGIMYPPTGLLEVGGCITAMWFLIGWQALTGIAFFLVVIAFNATTAAHASRLRHRAARIADKRLEFIGEIIQGIRAVKMFAWEWNYEKSIRDHRRREIKIINRIGTYFAGSLAFSITSASITAMVSIITFLLTDKELTSFVVFTLLSYLAALQKSICIMIGERIRHLGEMNISIGRIQKFLLEDPLFPDASVGDGKTVIKDRWLNKRFRKLSAYARGKHYQYDGFAGFENEAYQPSTPVLVRSKHKNYSTPKPGLSVSGLSCSWGEEENDNLPPVLDGVTMNAHENSIVIISGPVGSGKSSLLMTMIGELPLSGGKLSLDGLFSYSPQTPWVFSGSVKENILFGRPFDQNRYDAVLEACDLQKDINRFPNGDLTLIGQRGVTMSGGQRARISLSRAVYREADVYLLDDPLSAVDATVSKNIFEKCVVNLLSGKLRVLVTHQMQFLKRADHIVMLKQGSVVSQGTYPQLTESGALTTTLELNIEAEGQEAARRASVLADIEHSKDCDDEDTAVDMEQAEEHRATGSVTYKTYWNCFRSGLPAVLVVGLVLMFVAGQVAIMSPHIWLSHMLKMSRDQQKANANLYIYGGLVLSAWVFSFLRSFYFYYGIIRASSKLHGKMTSAVIKSPVLFFDNTPPGRIYNRFAKDIGTMDELLPPAFLWALQLLVYCLGSTLLSVGTNYWMVIAVVPLLFVFVYIAWYYLQTSRQIKRIEAVRCSSVYSHVTETITGLEVIRSSGMQKKFSEQFHRFVDQHTQAYFLMFSSGRWLGFRLDSLCVLFVTAVATAATLVSENAAVAGLALVFAVEAPDMAQYGIRMFSEVENLMTSVERVMTYTKLQPEPGYSISARPLASWPEKGTMEVKNLSLVYYEGGKEVLKGVSFSVQDKEKIGVVGRTGAGKSSVVTSLFRMPEPRGKIVIDGTNILSLDIQCSRRAMSVITQDPVLFSGDLRKNLDPFNCFQDPQIWMALEEVQMKSLVENLPGQLCHAVKESGANFSVGERQLLCLARALLQGKKIILMDEATANVDFETDRLIQEVIRSKFKDCTVLTIAHRLKTVIDYDKILVLDQGQVVEFDNPRVLLAKRDGVFAQFVRSHNLAIDE